VEWIWNLHPRLAAYVRKLRAWSACLHLPTFTSTNTKVPCAATDIETQNEETSSLYTTRHLQRVGFLVYGRSLFSGPSKLSPGFRLPPENPHGRRPSASDFRFSQLLLWALIFHPKSARIPTIGPLHQQFGYPFPCPKLYSISGPWPNNEILLPHTFLPAFHLPACRLRVSRRDPAQPEHPETEKFPSKLIEAGWNVLRAGLAISADFVRLYAL
jgi:hypothetical protein